MKSTIKFLPGAIAMIFFATSMIAQNNFSNHSNQIVEDSLKGFDEKSIEKIHNYQHYTSAELGMKLKQLKKNYINNKYNLKEALSYAIVPNLTKTPVIADCDNIDFENSAAGIIYASNQVNGWTITSGNNLTGGDNCNTNPTIGAANGISEIIDCGVNGYIDPNIGNQHKIFSIFGAGATNTLAGLANPQINGPMSGTKVLRLNDTITNDYSVQKLSRTIVVSENNAWFRFAFIADISSLHACCIASGLQFKISNAGTPIACPSFSVWAPSVGCINGYGQNLNFFLNKYHTPYNMASPTQQDIYNRWKTNSIDLTAYIGQTITLEILVYDCKQGGHYGYIYFDAQCSPLTMKINNHTVAASGEHIYLKNCGPMSTITAPPDFTSYVWTRPGGTTTTGQAFTISGYGTYTLALGQVGGCNVLKYVHVDAISIAGTASLLCEGSSATLTTSGFSSYEWSTGDSTETIIITPVNTTTYVVGGSMSNGEVCLATFVQHVTTCTGIDQMIMDEKSIRVYPNPNNGNFIVNIEKPLKNASLLIRNVLGQEVHNQFISEGENKVNNKLPAGVYYYTITADKLSAMNGKIMIE